MDPFQYNCLGYPLQRATCSWFPSVVKPFMKICPRQPFIFHFGFEYAWLQNPEDSRRRFYMNILCKECSFLGLEQFCLLLSPHGPVLIQVFGWSSIMRNSLVSRHSRISYLFRKDLPDFTLDSQGNSRIAYLINSGFN